MSILEDNMKVIQLTYPELYSMLKVQNKKENIYAGESLSGDPYLVVEREGERFTIGSTYFPCYESERFIRQFPQSIEKKSVVLFGLGLGYVTENVLNCAEEYDICIVMEPSIELLQCAIEVRDLTSLFKDERFYLYVGKEHMMSFLRCVKEHMTFHNWNMFHFVSLSNYEILFEDIYRDIIEQYDVIRHHKQIDQNTLIYFGKKTVENEIQTFRFLVHSKNFFDIKPYITEEIPCIIVAAGPSLEKNVQYLKLAKGKAFIFCVDRVANYLIQQGILPDMICTIDAGIEQNYFENDALHQVPIAITTSSSVKLLNEIDRPEVMYFSSEMMIHEKVFQHYGIDMPCIPGGGSVALNEFSLAVKLGFHTIILVGQDLAISTRQSHAGEKGLESGHDYSYWVSGYYDDQVVTNFEFKTYLEVYESWIRDLEGIQVINATEGGARIPGTIQISLKEAIRQSCKCEFCFQDIYNKIPYIVQTPKEQMDLYQMLEKHVDAVEMLQPKVSFSIMRIKGLLNHLESGNISTKELEEVNLYNAALLDEIRVSEASDMLYSYMMQTEEMIADVLTESGDEPIQELKKMYLQISDYMKELLDAIQFCIGRWHEVLKQLKKGV